MFTRLDDPDPPTFDDRHRRAVVGRARRRRRRRLAGGSVAVAASLVAGTAGLYGRALVRTGDVHRIRVAGTGAVPAGAPVTVLVVGLDGPGGRGDSVLVARLDPGTGRARLLSLPRDMLVTPPGGGAPVRLNTLAGRPDALVAVVEGQMGIGVDHVVRLDGDAFRALVDQLGGVRVDVPAPVRDRWSGLALDRTGCTTLDGAQALALARARHVEVRRPDGAWERLPAADLDRMADQRALVLAALADLGGRRDPVALNHLVDWAVEHVAVDDALDRGELLRLARAALALGPGDVAGSTLPVRPDPGDPNLLVPDGATARAATRAFVTGAAGPAGAAPHEPSRPVVSPC